MNDAPTATAEPDPAPNSVNGIATDRLRSIVDRIERLEEERKAPAPISKTSTPKQNRPASTSKPSGS